MITGIIIAYILSYFIKFILSAHDITNIIMIIAIIGPIRSLIFLDVSSGIVNSFFNNRFIISDVNSMMYSIMLVKKRSTKKVRNVFLMFFSSDVYFTIKSALVNKNYDAVIEKITKIHIKHLVMSGVL